MNLEEHIRNIVAAELSKHQAPEQLIPIAKFCAEKGISRVTLWRAERSGKVRIVRIGKRCFVDGGQFSRSLDGITESTTQ